MAVDITQNTLTLLSDYGNQLRNLLSGGKCQDDVKQLRQKQLDGVIWYGRAIWTRRNSWPWFEGRITRNGPEEETDSQGSSWYRY